MMKFFLLLFFICFTSATIAQTDSLIFKDIKRFQRELKTEYDNPYRSPLSAKAKKDFKGIHFFPINVKYVVKARFVRTPKEKPFQMSTSSGMRKTYVKYAEVFFLIDKKEYKLNVYQSLELIKSTEFKDYLFIPFNDATSGNETYEGGRYLDLTVTTGDNITLDFNKAYHPYCAYTEGYNCPIPPKENYVPVKIEAGVRF
jgi:uncharacterized protein (DUF1684 family)